MPVLETARLRLRPFREGDARALFLLLSDPAVNAFLPMFPLQSEEEAQALLRRWGLDAHHAALCPRYAVCQKEEDVPVGYVQVGGGESRDLGYALRRELWGWGLVPEACRAVLEQLRRAGVPYVTATHDVNNPRSGQVLKKLGMRYCYSYEEQWQPKNFPVIFRLYQLNLDGAQGRVFRGYWEQAAVHFVEN